MHGHHDSKARDNAKRLPRGATELKQWCEQQLERHEAYVVEHLEDVPEVRDWSLGDWASKADGDGRPHEVRCSTVTPDGSLRRDRGIAKAAPTIYYPL